MMSRKFIKILCIILAVLMALSGIAVIFSTFAFSGSRFVPTGENDMDVIIPVAVLALAVVVIVVCLIIPRIRKKDKE